MNKVYLLLIVLSILAVERGSVSQSLPLPRQPSSTEVDFSRDIRPILSDTCFKCHGPDEQQRATELRLDQQDSVFEEMMVVEPGDAQSSELYLRLTADDPDHRMPPPDSGRTLSNEQIELIRAWIDQGAEWGEHWSFVAPERPALPMVRQSNWPRNGIDQFVLHRQEQLGLQPAPRAGPEVLVRRLYLDLIGLPPTGEEAAAFLAEPSDTAYEQLVDRLLESPHYGEHMARYWLDAARYGDTHGLHLDNYREHFTYRDWIVEAFNSNMSYRDFALCQLAGDLMEQPTRDQLIATGFNRANVTTNEGGSITEEVRMRNVVDRVSTMGTVFMGLTIGCAQCHDHKFDPISQKEFYQLYAYFNAFDGDPMDGNRKDHEPVLLAGTDGQRQELETLNDKIAALQTRIQQSVADWPYVEPDDPPAVIPDPVDLVWIDDSLPDSGNRTGSWRFETSELGPVFSGDKSIVSASAEFSQNVLQNIQSPWPVTEGDILFVHVYLDPDNPPREIMLQWNDGNWEHRVYWGEGLVNFGKNQTPSRKLKGPLPPLGKWVQLRVKASEVNLQPGAAINGVALTQYGGRVRWDRIGAVTTPTPFPRHRSFADWQLEIYRAKGAGLPEPLRKIAEVPPEERDDAQVQQLRDHFIEHVYADSRSTFEKFHADQKRLVAERDALKSSIPTTLIYREKSEPVETFMLERGLYDHPGDRVERAVPAVFAPIADSEPNDRLGLARWLFSGEHPLTARVTVNRIWQQFFGRGIVETSEDFGSQGQFPSHPDLLDHLATEFVERGWDVKWLVKYIVTSATYQQSSRVGEQAYRADPTNRWLARGPRFRLDAETLRDQALSISGLLVRKLGGPGVKPPQPDGLWYAVGYSGSNTVRFKKDEGHEKVHRRSLYTFWKRTSPPPQMTAFDAPSRESCTVRRERTNTPLQALLLMNETQYVEAARHLAEQTLQESTASPQPAWDKTLVQLMFRRCLVRQPSVDEVRIILETLRSGREIYQADPILAEQLIQIGETPSTATGGTAIELAAWTMVANLIMNMDEFVTKN